jgi:hypothetical protein
MDRPARARQAAPGAGTARWLRRAAGWVVPAENPAGVVYGVIVIGALLAAESGLHETYLETAGSAAITATLYWLAHAYAGLLGRRLSTGERLTPGALMRALAHDWALVRGAAVPLLALLVAWATGASQETAVSVGLWSAAACLVLFELIAGIGSHSRVTELVFEVAVGATMGLGIIALKIVLH